ncbi:putative allantoate permease protein [Neofusicoccum parvum UCRNP2]|uniref:Putative allantoate permease protein n=1 Tax=Botryosphaeria parva (strain UCR-NP2) TaxID=1287680 RepID=R1ECY3_BOTPV|nr:putative allantoate permease protein [Neofusicoccum parvum UCRNP2]
MSIHEKSAHMDVEPQSIDHKVGVVKDVDQAAQFLAEAQEYPPLTPEQEKKLVRKVDWIMIPMLFLTATFGAVDKVSLSCFEAIIVPGISLIIAAFYKKEEQPPRNALVFAAASSVINGFLSWAIGHIDSALAIWQYLFLIIGSITFAWSLFVIFVLPATPMEAIFLSKEEKYHLVKRVATNKTGVANKEWKWSQVKEAFIDPKTWIIFFFNIAINIPNGGLTTFNSIIIANLGFSSVDASLLTACIVPIIGTAVVYAVPRDNIAGQMVGIYLLYTYFGPYVVGIGLAQANTAGNTKKTVVFAVLYIGYAVGNLIGPQTFRANQAPEYTGGVVAMIVCYCVCIGLICAYWAVCAFNNKRSDEQEVHAETNEEAIELLLDQTDFEQKGFRYTT